MVRLPSLTRRQLITSLAVALLVSAAPLVVHAEGFIEGMVKDLMYMLIQFFGWMTTLLFKVLEIVSQYNGFTTEPIVVKGWTIVRDICNMFFVFAMLLIAFGTILRIQAYHYRSLLFKVVLMAVLMNLSKSIVGVLIDLSQVVMLSFVSGFKHMIAGGMAQALGIDKVLQLEPTATEGAVNQAAGVGGQVNDGFVASSGTLLASFILAMLLMALVFITVLAITVQLIVRVIKLWILTIMAPIAFAGTLFKGLGSMAGKWWDELTKELVAGPTLMFFLWLVLAISASNSGEVFGAGSTGAGSFNPLNLEAAAAGNLVNMFVVVGLLWAGLAAAKAGGTAAAGIAGMGLAKIAGAGRGAAAWTGSKARGAAVGTGRFAQRWTAQGLSRSGIQGKYEMAKEGIRDSAAGKAVRFFGKEATEQRWAARGRLRQERVLKHFERAEEAADIAKQPVGWIQSAKRRREQQWRVESNVAVGKKVKEMEERGIIDDASIRAELAANQRGGQVLDVDKQSALLRLLASKGKVLDANRDIVDNTTGMSNATRASLLASFKDHDTSAIKSDGSLRTEDEQREEIESSMKGDATREAKNKRVRGIAAKVRLDESGKPANSSALAVLQSLDEDYIEPLDKKVKDDIKEALLLAAHNARESGDENLQKSMVAKYNQLFGKDKEGNELPADQLLAADAVATDPKLREVQLKAIDRQERDQVKAVKMKRDQRAPLDENERAWGSLLEAVDDAPGKIDALRAKLLEFSSLDMSSEADREKADELAPQIEKLQQSLEQAAVDASTGPDGKPRPSMVLRGSDGQPIAPDQFMRKMIGGDIAGGIKTRLREQPGAAARYASDQQQSLAARGSRVISRGSTLDSPGRPVAARAQAFASKYVPGAPRYQSGRAALADTLADLPKIQAAITSAFGKADTPSRLVALAPVMKQIDALVDEIKSSENDIDPVTRTKLPKLLDQRAKVKSRWNTASAEVSSAELQSLVSELGKLKDIS